MLRLIFDYLILLGIIILLILFDFHKHLILIGQLILNLILIGVEVLEVGIGVLEVGILVLKVILIRFWVFEVWVEVLRVGVGVLNFGILILNY